VGSAGERGTEEGRGVKVCEGLRAFAQGSAGLSENRLAICV